MTEDSDTSHSADLRRRYVDLLCKALLNETCLEAEAAYSYARECAEGQKAFDPTRAYNVRRELHPLYTKVAEARRIGRHLDRDLGKVGFSATMIGRLRMEHLQDCVSRILAADIAGDLIECGVWRGGAVIFMRGLLAAHDVRDRLVWVADSFRGLPEPSALRDDPDLGADRFPQLAVDAERVREHFERYGLLDDQVRLLEGWFHDTLPSAPIDRLALLRIDADYYDSTWEPLRHLYNKVSVGGFVIIDDYSLIPACKAAVDDFRRQEGITCPVEPVDQDCVYWRKSGDL